MITATAEIRVRYAETDGMGIAYHANYLAWFEVARCALLESIGLSYRQLDADNYLLPVLEAGVRFHAPARFDDRLHVTASITTPPRVRIRVDYEVRLNGRLITAGHTVHAFMNRDGVAIKPPAHVQECFARAFAPAHPAR
ncbi:MAG: acyl-CoA thioesterase [Puniceicoccales bacterium]|jgi:acyl-CoA thioester hydrolase|nr:acyl-CoA thioesterase [Puniceicoccales bacterium]